VPLGTGTCPPLETIATAAASAAASATATTTSEIPEPTPSTRESIVHDVVENRAELERQSEEDEVLFVCKSATDPGQELVVGQLLEGKVKLVGDQRVTPPEIHVEAASDPE
jgi:hypothetical protein